MSTTAAVQKVSKEVAVRNVIESPAQRDQFLRALPAQIPADKFIRVLLTTVAMNPWLHDCSQRSIIASAMKAAQDGLLLDGREAALVKYAGDAQYLPMVAGILKKMRQSGEIASVSAHVVKANDDFAYELGDEERIVHRPLLTGERGATIAAYAVVKTKDGGVYREVMTLEQIEKARQTSKAKGGPWADWYDEMAEKTVLKRIAKRCPSSTDLQTVIDHENEVAGTIDRGAMPSGAPSAPGRPRVLERIKAETEAPYSPEANPESEDAAHPCSEGQQKCIHTLLGKVGYENRDAEFAYISGLVGRPISSTKELSELEAGEVISDLDEKAALLAGEAKA